VKGQSTDKIKLFDESGKSRGLYSKRNILNNLTGREWVFSTKSVINKPYPINMQHKLRSQHGGQKPPDLCRDLIETFTKENQSVLDPFAGVGGTLLGASLCGRQAIGIEINQQWIDIYKEVCKKEQIEVQRMIHGDSCEVLPDLIEQGTTVDFILTDVPYWSMDKVQRSKGKYKRVGEKQKENKATKLKQFNQLKYESKEDWLDKLRVISLEAIDLLKRQGYMAVFIGDMYNNKEFHFLSSDVAQMLQRLGLTMKANLVWYDVSKKLHIYGYQYEYIPSMVHQNILIFRKEERQKLEKEG